MRAARYYELSPEEIAFDLVGKRHGFVKRRRRVILRVDPDHPKREAREPRAPKARHLPSPAPKPVEPEKRTPPEAVREAAPEARPATSRRAAGAELPKKDLPRAEGALALAVEKCLDLILHFLHLAPEAEVLQGDGCLEVELAGKDAAFLLRDDGALLWALEDLLPRFVFGLIGETVAVRVDANGFRRGRQLELERMARAVADEVDESGRPRALEALSPAERRVIHETLADDPRVTSKSEGRGLRRQIVVRPR